MSKSALKQTQQTQQTQKKGSQKMNTLNLYSVYDRKTGVFSPPAAYPHLEDAKRNFALLLRNNPKSIHACFPEDYGVFFVGVIDLSNGSINTCHSPSQVFSFSELVSQER